MRFENKNFDYFNDHFNQLEEFVQEGRILRKEDFGRNIGADLIWDDNLPDNNNMKKNGVWHLYFLIGMIEILYNFLLNPNRAKEKNYIARLWYEYQPYFLIVNNIDEDGFIHFFNSGEALPTYKDGTKVCEIDHKEYEGHRFLVDFILAQAQQYKNSPFLQDRVPNITETPKSILQKFLPCFEQHIYDISTEDRKLIWETPLLKETMSNYNALKKYAQKQGWIY